MSTLDFRGKRHIYAHHYAVPHRPLVPEPDSCGRGRGRTMPGSSRSGTTIATLEASLNSAGAYECGEVSLDNGQTQTKGRFKIVFREDQFGSVLA